MGGAASKYFSEVEFIPLETTKESLFGEIDHLEITDQYYIVYDNATDAILFFEKNGKYHHKFTNFKFDRVLKLSPNPLHPQGSVISFTVDPIKKWLYIQSTFESDYMYIYDYEGKRKGKFRLPADMTDFSLLSDGSFYYRLSRPSRRDRAGKSHPPYELAYRKDTTSPLNYVFPVDTTKMASADDINGHPHYLFGFTGDSTCMFTPDIDYNIYELNAGGIKNQYQILFPQQVSLPVNFATDPAYYKKWDAYMKEHKVIGGILGAYKSGNNLLLIFAMPVTDYAKAGFYYELYNLKSSRLIALNNISPDAKSFQLPVSHPMRSGILACGNDNLYFSYPSNIMFGFRDSFGDKPPAFSAKLVNYFKTQDRKSNPVLLRLKVKSDI
jgi:hypothetical protein